MNTTPFKPFKPFKPSTNQPKQYLLVLVPSTNRIREFTFSLDSLTAAGLQNSNLVLWVLLYFTSLPLFLIDSSTIPWMVNSTRTFLVTFPCSPMLTIAGWIGYGIMEWMESTYLYARNTLFAY